MPNDLTPLIEGETDALKAAALKVRELLPEGGGPFLRALSAMRAECSAPTILRLIAAAESAAAKDAEIAALSAALDAKDAAVEYWRDEYQHSFDGHESCKAACDELRDMAAESRQRAEKAEADARLLWGVVHNIKGQRDRARLAAVREAIGCGSQVAMELCRRFDADPDATWHPTRGWQADTASQPAAEAGTGEAKC